VFASTASSGAGGTVASTRACGSLLPSTGARHPFMEQPPPLDRRVAGVEEAAGRRDADSERRRGEVREEVRRDVVAARRREEDEAEHGAVHMAIFVGWA